MSRKVCFSIRQHMEQGFQCRTGFSPWPPSGQGDRKPGCSASLGRGGACEGQSHRCRQLGPEGQTRAPRPAALLPRGHALAASPGRDPPLAMDQQKHRGEAAAYSLFSNGAPVPHADNCPRALCSAPLVCERRLPGSLPPLQRPFPKTVGAVALLKIGFHRLYIFPSFLKLFILLVALFVVGQ